jgi:hypothetical protein
MTRFWKAVLLTTLVAGTLDILAAHVDLTIRTGAFPARMFYVIAAGAIGLKNALNGGPGIILLGVLIHYFIAFSFTLLFYLLYPAITRLSQNKYFNGALYGVVVWGTMNFIVLPLTALPNKPFVFNIQAIIGCLVLMVVLGIPISIMAHKYYRAVTTGDKVNNGNQAAFI